MSLVLAGSVLGCSGYWDPPNYGAGAGAVTGTDPITWTCATRPFGLAGAFTVFTEGDYSGVDADVSGRIASGGNAAFLRYTVGDYECAHASCADVVAAGDISFTETTMPIGHAVYGHTALISDAFLGGGQGQAFLFDFQQAADGLRSLSTTLAGLPVNGTTKVTYSGEQAELDFTGEDPVLNVFQLDGNDLNHAHTMRITAPEGATCLVNVSGEELQMVQFGIYLTGVTRERVLFNLPTATKLHLERFDITASLLAPNADLTFKDGQLNGQLFAHSLAGNVQVNEHRFAGCVALGVNGAGNDDAAPPASGSLNCTLPPDGWMAWTGFGVEADTLTSLLPQTLGASGSASSLRVPDRNVAHAIFTQQVYGAPINGISQLYSELLAARLSITQGADFSAIADDLAAIEAFLATHDYRDWRTSLTTDELLQVIDWKAKLASFNDGTIGPGRCN